MPGPEIADERPPGGRSQRDDPFLRALAENVERSVRADVADPEGHDLGQSESRVEEKQDERPLAVARQGQQAAELRVAERGDESARNVWPSEGPEARRCGELFCDAPVAECLQTADVAGDRLGRERAPELEQPGSKLGRRDFVDRPWLAEPANRPDEDHPVPLDGPRRRSFGRLGGAEQVGGGARFRSRIGPKVSSASRRTRPK